MRNIIFLICVAALLIVGCNLVKTNKLSTYSGQISFYENTAEYYSGDRIKKCMLSDTVILGGYHCISWIHFFESGRIKQFETARNIESATYTIPAGSILFFNDQNPDKIKNIWFSKDVIINSIGCMGGAKISTEFYDNGSLKACFLTNDQNIQGFPCKSSLFEPIYFYPDGKIKILTLSSDLSQANTLYKSGESIAVDENGRFSRFNR
jgi:hypothetical protein